MQPTAGREINFIKVNIDKSKEALNNTKDGFRFINLRNRSRRSSASKPPARGSRPDRRARPSFRFDQRPRRRVRRELSNDSSTARPRHLSALGGRQRQGP